MGHLQGGRLVLEVLKWDQELVTAALPNDGVMGGHHRPKPVQHDLQEVVTGVVRRMVVGERFWRFRLS